MSTKREFIDYLEDIADAIEKIENFTYGMDYDQFITDDKTVFAVIRAFEIIGEATKKVPVQIKTGYSNLPWKEIAGFRDKLTHEYFGIDLKVVWQTLKKDIPLIKPTILDLLKEYKKISVAK